MLTSQDFSEMEKQQPPKTLSERYQNEPIEGDNEIIETSPPEEIMDQVSVIE